MAIRIDKVGERVYICPGDPTGLPLSAFNVPAGVIVIDANGGYPFIKTSALGSNAGFERMTTAAPAITAIPYAASITPAVSSGIINVGTLTGNITINNPSATPADGKLLDFRFTQDATGGRTITWGNQFAFGTDVTAALIPTTANAKWEMAFRWHATDSKWRAVGIARGF